MCDDDDDVLSYVFPPAPVASLPPLHINSNGMTINKTLIGNTPPQHKEQHLLQETMQSRVLLGMRCADDDAEDLKLKG